MNASRTKVNWFKYFLVLLISLFIFTTGLYLGNYGTNLKFQNLYNLQEEIRSEVMGAELQYAIFENNPCSLNDTNVLIQDIYKIGSRLTSMEQQLGTDNADVLSLKEYYNLLEIRHFLFMSNVIQKCNKSYKPILYFYSNAGDCSKCEEQGYVLSYVSENNPLFYVYSFDININNPAIDALKKFYGINVTPSIVVNGKTYEGLQTKEDIYKEILK